MPEQQLRYPEKRLQESAIAWIEGQWGYREQFADAEATGARLDSIGLIDGRLILIEVKTAISATIVEHQEGRAQSIESKVSGGLRAIYCHENGALATAANRVWDRCAPPKIVILAENVSDGGLRALASMLGRRSVEWLFDAEVWRWTGEAVEVIWAVRIAPPHRGAYSDAKIDRLIDRSLRAKARGIDDLQQLANEKGSGELFAFFIETAQSNGFQVNRGRSSVSFKFNLYGSQNQQTVLGVYLAPSPPGALNVGCWSEVLDHNGKDLPGKDAPTAGFLNTNRLIETKEEISELINLFKYNIIESDKI